MKAQSIKRKFATALLVVSSVLVATIAPANASPQGHIQGQEGVGFFYGTFNESPNIILLAGGDVDAFCQAGPDGNAGSAPSRVFFRSDGSVDIKVNDKDQPIFLYEVDFPGAPEWLDEVCAGPTVDLPEPFATGTADLKIRVSVISDNLVDVFNSVNGTASGSDGTNYKVHASADLIIENGMLVGDPEDLVTFSLKKLGN